MALRSCSAFERSEFSFELWLRFEEIVVELALCAFVCDFRRTEHESTEKQPASPREFKASLSKSNPVEVVESPEPAHKSASRDKTLFTGCVYSTTVEKSKLHPCSEWVTVRPTSFIL